MLSIGKYTLQTWGQAQADRYISELKACCRHLASNPLIGRSCDEVKPGLRRMEKGKHVLFYRLEPGGVRVVRILHQRMLPGRHAMD